MDGDSGGGGGGGAAPPPGPAFMYLCVHACVCASVRACAAGAVMSKLPTRRTRIIAAMGRRMAHVLRNSRSLE